jgi:ParB family chromosome partitioning protein
MIRSIPLDSIESDPKQPREYFDPKELHELAESLKSEGLLQEPAVYPIQLDDDGIPVRFRLLFGERRWRAARLAGWTEMRCKVLPKDRDETLEARVKRIDQQEAENARRAALSAVEEARAIRVKLEALEAARPDATRNEIVAKIALERGLPDETVAWRLLGLLDAPESLRQAILEKKITSREVAFLLASHWRDLRDKHAAACQGKREVQFRNRFREWARAQDLEVNADTVKKYAGEQFLDPKVVRETLRAADRIEREAEQAFQEVVGTAVRKGWTVQEARASLRIRKAAPGAREGAVLLPLFERSQGRGKERFVVHLDRLGDQELATPEARAELANALRALLAQVEAPPASDTRRTEGVA